MKKIFLIAFLIIVVVLGVLFYAFNSMHKNSSELKTITENTNTNNINNGLNNKEANISVKKPENKDLKVDKVAKTKIDVDLFLSVPYITKGNMFLVNDDENIKIKLDKINNASYKLKTKLVKGLYYYFKSDLGKSNSKIKADRDLIYSSVDFWSNQKKTKIDLKYKGYVFGGMILNKYNDKEIDYGLDTLSEFNIDTIVIVPEWFMENINADDISPHYDKMPVNWIAPTIKDDKLRDIIKKAQERNIKVILKPQIDSLLFGTKPDESRGNINPKDWDKWFKSYKTFILHYAKISQEFNLPIFIIGTELDTTMRLKDSKEKWENIIKDIRKIYSGRLTYSVSCFGECYSPKQVLFWDKLDYIGFEPYFSLLEKDLDNYSLKHLKDSFKKKWDKFLKPLSDKYNKPVLLTEVNAYSYDNVFVNPLGPVDNYKANQQKQQDYYEALFESLENINYVKGVFLWGYYLDSIANGLETQQLNDKYDPFIRKKAGQVIKKWFK